MEKVIEVCDMCKTYPAFALDHVSFSIPSGCAAGFIGLNGQGKTTTIRSILNLAKKDSGTVRLMGMDIDREERGIKDRLGVVFDEGYLYDSLSMHEMTELVSGAYMHWDQATYEDLMKRFDLAEQQRIAGLSKGMRMKYALTLALSHHAELLIMDEPTSGLDPLVRKEVIEMLSQFLGEGGKGVFYSTHITSDLDKFADVLVFIHKGRIVFAKDKDELLDTHYVVKGNPADLTPELRDLFVNLQVNDFGFKGLTRDVRRVKAAIPTAVFERANIESIMLAYV